MQWGKSKIAEGELQRVFAWFPVCVYSMGSLEGCHYVWLEWVLRINLISPDIGVVWDYYLEKDGRAFQRRGVINNEWGWIDE